MCCMLCAAQGYAGLAAGLEMVSEQKGAVDEAKGQVLQVGLSRRMPMSGLGL